MLEEFAHCCPLAASRECKGHVEGAECSIFSFVLIKYIYIYVLLKEHYKKHHTSENDFTEIKIQVLVELLPLGSIST